MATYSAGVALAFTYEVADGTTGSYSPGGDDRAVFGTIVCGGFSGLPSITELRYGGSGGTIIDRVGSDLTWVGGNGAHGVFAEAPGPTGSTTLFGDWAATPLQSAIAALHYSGVDQTTPFSGHVDATPTFANAVTTTVASVTVTGCTAGQTIVAAVGALSDGVVLSAFSAVSGTTLRVSDVTGTFVGVAMLEKVATGSTETLEVNVNGSSSAGLYWTARGARVNDAAGGDSVISAATGAATASVMAGSSTAVTTAAAAAGAATASAATGSATANSTRASASGVATTSAAAGSSTASAAEGTAAGAATTGALAGSSTAVASFVAAAGVATTSTMSSDVGASIIAQANGVATASAMDGASTAIASFNAASGQATAGEMRGNDPIPTGGGGGRKKQKLKYRVIQPQLPIQQEPEELPGETEEYEVVAVQIDEFGESISRRAVDIETEIMALSVELQKKEAAIQQQIRDYEDILIYL